jgi:F-type H+-transporting ATPase subunit epsilon
MAEGPNTFQARILTPEGEVFDGEVRQLSTRTVAGEIGILANHVPVMARLEPTELRLHMAGSDEVQRFAQGEGWLEVFANRALALVQEAVPPDQLDTADLKEKLADADQRLSEAKEDSAAYELAARDKMRIETFLRLAEGE